jgi:hypothetical protein
MGAEYIKALAPWCKTTRKNEVLLVRTVRVPTDTFAIHNLDVSVRAVALSERPVRAHSRLLRVWVEVVVSARFAALGTVFSHTVLNG